MLAPGGRGRQLVAGAKAPGRAPTRCCRAAPATWRLQPTGARSLAPHVVPRVLGRVHECSEAHPALHKWASGCIRITARTRAHSRQCRPCSAAVRPMRGCFFACCRALVAWACLLQLCAARLVRLLVSGAMRRTNRPARSRGVSCMHCRACALFCIGAAPSAAHSDEACGSVHTLASCAMQAASLCCAELRAGGLGVAAAARGAVGSCSAWRHAERVSNARAQPRSVVHVLPCACVVRALVRRLRLRRSACLPACCASAGLFTCWAGLACQAKRHTWHTCSHVAAPLADRSPAARHFARPHSAPHTPAPQATAMPWSRAPGCPCRTWNSCSSTRQVSGRM